MRVAMHKPHEAATGGESGGQGLVEERKRLGLSQGHLARLAGLSLRQVRETERRPLDPAQEVTRTLLRAVEALHKRIRLGRGWLARNGAAMFEQGGPAPPGSGWRPSSRIYCAALSLLSKYDIGEGGALMLLRERNAAASQPVPDEWLVEEAGNAAYAARHLRQWAKQAGGESRRAR